MDEKITLVTGSAGRIGRAVVRELRERSHGVRGFDRVPSPGMPDFVVGDLTDFQAIETAMRGVSTLVHLAATPDDADFLNELVPNNVIGVYNVFEAARLAGVKRLILASSGQVVWYRRETPPYPIGADVAVTPKYWYAALKVFLEAAGRAFADAHGMSVLSVRLGWCPRSPEQIAEISTLDWAPDIYLSPADAGRFFACAVEAPGPLKSILYATSKPVKQAIYDLDSAWKLIGYVPHDCWPQGVEDMRRGGDRVSG